MRQIIVGKELRSVRDAGQGDGESPVLLIGNEEEVALPFGEFERLRPHGGLAFGLIGEITNNVHLVVKHGSAGRVAMMSRTVLTRSSKSALVLIVPATPLILTAADIYTDPGALGSSGPINSLHPAVKARSTARLAASPVRCKMSFKGSIVIL